MRASNGLRFVPALAPETWNKLERLLEHFEEAWKSGQRPELKDYLAAVGRVERFALLVELIHEDMDYRHSAGEPACVANYLRCYPELEDHPQVVLDLIATEYGLRRRREPHLTVMAFLRQWSQAHLPGDLQDRSKPPEQAVEEGTATKADRADRCPTPLTVRTASWPEATMPACQWPSIPGYQVLAELGRGGMGIVYKARQVQLNRLVALKMILAGAHAPPDQVTRFLAEAQTVARLQHPHIVQVYEIGQHEGRPYFSLEFMAGGSLDRQLAGKPQPPGEAAALTELLARAVHVAHQQGIVHRDLKPANILLGADGIPKVADFGLAKQLGDAQGQTFTGQVLGTPSYMAPEQEAGSRSKEIGPETDVYGLGTILYVLVTGGPPFGRATVSETLRQVAQDDPVPPRRLQPIVAPDLETICLKCLAKDSRKRYRTAVELAEDLSRFQAGKPIQARPVGVGERTWMWARRHPAQAVSLGLLALVLLLALGSSGAMVLWQKAEAARRQAQAAEQAAEDLANRLAEAQRQQAHSAYCDRIYLVQQEVAAKKWHRARELLEGCDPSLRGWEWHHFHNLTPPAPRTLGVHANRVRDLAFSPDGRCLASAGNNPAVKLWDAATGKELASLVGHQGGVALLAFSPQGHHLACGTFDKKVKLWDIASAKELAALAGHRNSIFGLAFSPDGRCLATASSDHTAKLWDVATGKELATLAGHTQTVWRVAFSPDSRRLATASKDRTAKLWDVPSGKELATLAAHQDEVRQVIFSPDSRRLVTASWDRTLKLWDTATGGELITFNGHQDSIQQVAWSPDGRRLASASHDQTVKLWDVASGKELAMLAGSQAATVRDMAFSPDGRRLVCMADDKTVTLWDMSSYKKLDDLMVQPSAIDCMALSPDGRHLATANAGQTIQLWAIAADLEAAVPIQNDDRFVHLSFSPDGQRLATGAMGQTSRLWEAATGRELAAIAGQKDQVGYVHFCPDGRCWALTHSNGPPATLWDLDNREELVTLTGRVPQNLAAAFSPDGARLATWFGWRGKPVTDGTVRLWDSASGREVLTLTGHSSEVEGAIFSPDGSRLATASMDQTVRLWEVATGKSLATLAAPSKAILHMTFSPDGSRLAICYAMGVVGLWHIPTGYSLAPPHQFVGQIVRVAFSPDSKVLALACWDGTVRLWDPASGQPRATFTGHSAKVDYVAFSPDGTRLASASRDRTVRLWDVATGKPLATLPLAILGGPPYESAWHLLFSPDGNHLAAWCHRGTVLLWRGPETPADRATRFHFWQERQAATAEEKGDWFVAAYYLRLLLRRTPDAKHLQDRLTKAQANLLQIE